VPPSPHKSEHRGPALALVLLLAALAAPAHAYIGPGAGFALVTSVGVVFFALIVAVFAVLTWPIRMAWRAVRRPKRGKARIRRFFVLGLDGQDPRLTDRFMKEGRLPNFQKLAEMGCYRRLKTTFPSVSPVAWSSFATGCHPAKHNIYDFLDRDRKTYLPVLSSTDISTVKRRGLAGLLAKVRFGRYRLPAERPVIRLLRKAKPFWTVLGEHYVWSTVLRVPITFPPDRFYGAQLAAMCVPDLLGTQGTFLLFTTRPSGAKFKEGGMRVALTNGAPDRYQGTIAGPPNAYIEGDPPMTLPLAVECDRAAGKARVTIDGQALELAPEVLSDWVKLEFKAAPTVKVPALVRLQLLEMGEHVSLYMTPLNFDPESPAMPISHPGFYAQYLAKKIGPYSTLGLAEDTWALNEGVIDDGTFLAQTWDIDAERERMWFAAMERLRRGALVAVFDATDRIQHMFWRYLEPGHPAGRNRDAAEHREAIRELYERNDALVGRVMAKLKKGDVLFVISDHGFTSFRRGVNVNAWLLANGYLHLKEGGDGRAEWLHDVDWSRTRAYALGLTGMFLNVEGREAQGIVEPGAEAERLKSELVEKLSGLVDSEQGVVGITEAFDTARLYHGPYLGNAPDILLGYNSGYRTSWDCATGVVAGPVFEDNTKAWSGDHCVDPRQVPGVLFCNYPIDDDDPALMDVAPTALELFGITPPPQMDGKALFAKTTTFGEKSRPQEKGSK
jgi:predicted AlkP superfamily phosphohydrolase/phosphomutase